MLISIIIATQNRANQLKDILESILKQETEGIFDYELIFVDNNSKDKTKETVQSYADRFNGRFHYFFEGEHGKCQALTTGIAQAKGEILIFTDDDVVVDSRWLLNIVRCFQTERCDAVGGRVLPVYPKNTPQWISDNRDILSGPIVDFDYGENISPFDSKKMLPFLGANIAFRNEVFQACGLFRPDLGPGTGIMGDDTEFFRRVLSKGKKAVYCGQAVVWHPVDVTRMSLKYIAKWNISSGRYWPLIDNKEQKENEVVFRFLGVPRYLIRQLVVLAGSLPFYVLNQRNFLKHWSELFLLWGRIVQYRRIEQCRK